MKCIARTRIKIHNGKALVPKYDNSHSHTSRPPLVNPASTSNSGNKLSNNSLPLDSFYFRQEIEQEWKEKQDRLRQERDRDHFRTRYQEAFHRPSTSEWSDDVLDQLLAQEDMQWLMRQPVTVWQSVFDQMSFGKLTDFSTPVKLYTKQAHHP